MRPPAATTKSETTPKVSPHNTNASASGESLMGVEASGEPLIRVEASGEPLMGVDASGKPLMCVEASGASPRTAQSWNRGGGGR